jgi:hypothetical protein
LALEGTLRDFSVADIFQLIGLQRKSGVLTVKREGEVVTVSFAEGAVVAADTLHRPLEDRLGTVLVKSGKLTEARLNEALAVQSKTLQRLGFILLQKRFIESDDLARALNSQITHVVYRLFRWRAGDYHFSQETEVEYDREYFVPIPAENILLESARIADEWPTIERRIPSFDLIFHPLEEAPETAEAPSVYEQDIDFELLGGESGAAPIAKTVRLAPDELEVYRLVDGQRTVQEVIDSTDLGEFDTCRVLCQLLDRHLIRQAAPVGIAEDEGVKRRPWIPWMLLGGVVLAFVICGSALLALGQFLTMVLGPARINLSHPGHPPGAIRSALAVPELNLAINRTRIERVDRAVYAGCYAFLARTPERLSLGPPFPGDLSDPGPAGEPDAGLHLLDPADLRDSRGVPFNFDRGLGGGGTVPFYEIGGTGPSGNQDSRLLIHRELWTLRPWFFAQGPEKPASPLLDTDLPGS